MSSTISSSLEDEVESSLFEEFRKDIFQGLKEKQNGKKEGRLFPYIIHMSVLIYVLSINLL
jgi:hypothetical protein